MERLLSVVVHIIELIIHIIGIDNSYVSFEVTLLNLDKGHSRKRTADTFSNEGHLCQWTKCIKLPFPLYSGKLGGGGGGGAL